MNISRGYFNFVSEYYAGAGIGAGSIFLLLQANKITVDGQTSMATKKLFKIRLKDRRIWRPRNYGWRTDLMS